MESWRCYPSLKIAALALFGARIRRAEVIKKRGADNSHAARQTPVVYASVRAPSSLEGITGLINKVKLIPPPPPSLARDRPASVFDTGVIRSAISPVHVKNDLCIQQTFFRPQSLTSIFLITVNKKIRWNHQTFCCRKTDIFSFCCCEKDIFFDYIKSTFFI